MIELRAVDDAKVEDRLELVEVNLEDVVRGHGLDRERQVIRQVRVLEELERVAAVHDA